MSLYAQNQNPRRGSNPCCCELSVGVKTIAILEIVVAFLIILAFAFILGNLDNMVRDPNYILLAQIICIITLIVETVSLIMGIVLLISVVKKSRPGCIAWLVFQTIFLVIYVVSMVLAPTDYGYTGIVRILIAFYFIYVVYCYSNQLKMGPVQVNSAYYGVQAGYPSQPGMYQPMYPNPSYSQGGMTAQGAYPMQQQGYQYTPQQSQPQMYQQGGYGGAPQQGYPQPQQTNYQGVSQT